MVSNFLGNYLVIRTDDVLGVLCIMFDMKGIQEKVYNGSVFSAESRIL